MVGFFIALALFKFGYIDELRSGFEVKNIIIIKHARGKTVWVF